MTAVCDCSCGLHDTPTLPEASSQSPSVEALPVVGLAGRDGESSKHDIWWGRLHDEMTAEVADLSVKFGGSSQQRYARAVRATTLTQQLARMAQIEAQP